MNPEFWDTDKMLFPHFQFKIEIVININNPINSPHPSMAFGRYIKEIPNISFVILINPWMKSDFSFKLLFAIFS